MSVVDLQKLGIYGSTFSAIRLNENSVDADMLVGFPKRLSPEFVSSHIGSSDHVGYTF